MGNLALKQLGIGTLLNGNKSYGIVTGTVSGLRISNVAGAYFIDNCSALLPYSGCRVRFKDSGGKYFDCLLGLRGVSETLSATEKVVNGDMELDSNWTSGLSPVINERSSEQAHSGTYSRKFAADSNYDQIYQPISLTTNALYLVNVWTFGDGVTRYALTAKLYSADGSDLSQYIVYPALWTNIIYRGTNTQGAQAAIVAYGVFGSGVYMDDYSVKQITAPSNQGLLLQAAPTVDSGFTYNAASYTYQIWS